MGPPNLPRSLLLSFTTYFVIKIVRMTKPYFWSFLPPSIPALYWAPYLDSKRRRQSQKWRSVIGLYSLFFLGAKSKHVKIILIWILLSNDVPLFFNVRLALIKKSNDAPPFYNVQVNKYFLIMQSQKANLIACQNARTSPTGIHSPFKKICTPLF